MLIFIQIQGLILNIYLIFLIITSKKKNIILDKFNISNINKEIKLNKFSYLQHLNEDHNKLIFLSRLTIILLICYSLFEIDFLKISNDIKNNLDINILDGIFKFNKLKSVIVLFIIFLAIIIITSQKSYIYNSTTKKTGEIFLIKLTNILGIVSLIYSNDWVMTIISWELFNYTLYLLVSINSYSEKSISSSLKYFILSALTTGILFLSISLIYYHTGNTNYDIVALNIIELFNNNKDTKLLKLALLLLVFAILFKLSAFPFYNWAPDLYDNLNTNITMWMMIIPKLAVLSFLLILSIENILPFSNITSINNFILISGLLSITLGSIALYNQWNLKRFLAYSSISHIGYILLGLYCNSIESYIIYIVIYLLTTLNIFKIIILLSQYQNRDIKYISQLIGLFKFNPFLAFCLAINFLSLAGRYANFIIL